MTYRAAYVLPLVVFIGNCISICGNDAPKVLTCNSEENITFDFPLGAVIQSAEQLLVGAAAVGAQEFALASLGTTASSFKPLAPERVLVNNQEAVSPLFNAPISLISPFAFLVDNLRPSNHVGSADTVLATTQNDPDMVYLTFKERSTLFTVLGLRLLDGAEQPIAKTVDLASMTSGLGVAAVIGNGNTDFTPAGGGIRYLATTPRRLPGSVQRQIILVNSNFLPLSSQTDAVTIGQNLQSVDESVVLHYDLFLRVLFTGICGQANVGATDGVKAVTRLRTINNGRPLTEALEGIALDAVFTGAADKIVGATGASEQVCIHGLDTLHVVSQGGAALRGPSYLLVLGGNGAPATTRQQIYALPVVSVDKGIEGDPVNKPNIGLLADVTQQPKVITQGDQNFIIGRGFAKPAENASQVYTSSSPEALVGGGAFDVPIDSFFVVGNAVFVVVKQEGMSKPGLFYSEPILDAAGVIQGWSTWQRYGNITRSLLNAAVVTSEPRALSFDVANNTTAVRSTIWSDGCADGFGPLQTFVTSALTAETGGVHAFQSFVKSTVGLNNIGLLAFAGADTLVLAQTNQDDGGGVDEPVAGEAFTTGAQKFTNGVIDHTFVAGNQTRSIAISGPVLEELECKTAVAVGAQTGNNPSGYLFIGGVDGLAVLTSASGDGWDASVGLSSGFVGLTQGMSFVKVPGFASIRALSASNGYLYVLTDSTLDRIDLNNSNFATKTIVSTQLAVVNDLVPPNSSAGFTDLLVSEKVALLGTTFGFFVNGAGSDVQTATNASDMGWRSLALPGSTNQVVRISSLSQSGSPADTSAGVGGVVYVLSGNSGAESSRVHRFAVQSTQGQVITEDTVTLIDDQVFENIDSFFVAFGTFRAQFSYDSALIVSGQNAMVNQSAGSSEPISAMLRAGVEPRDARISLGKGFVDRIADICHAPGSGAWLAVTDAGLQANE